jgi:hypothetical protein
VIPNLDIARLKTEEVILMSEEKKQTGNKKIVHTDSRPIEIDQDHLFVTRQLGYKKALDDIKEDVQELPSRGVPNTPGGSIVIDILQILFVIALIVFIINSICAAGQGGLRSAYFLGSLAIDAGIIAVLVFLSFLEKWIYRK